MEHLRMPRGGKREGAGRKPKYGNRALKPVTAYLPPDLIEAIARRALEYNIPKNEVVVTSLIKNFL